MKPILELPDLMSVLCTFVPLECAGRLAAAGRGQLTDADIQTIIASSVEGWTARSESPAGLAQSHALQAFARAVPARIALAMTAAARQHITGALLAELHRSRKRNESRLSVSKALGWHGAQGNFEVVAALVRMVRTERKNVEELSVCAAAATSLGCIAEAGCVATTDVLLKAILHPSASKALRTAAEQSLLRTATPELLSFTKRLQRALLNPLHYDCRQALARLLRRSAGVGNKDVVSSLARGLNHLRRSVRIAAATGLANVAEVGDRGALCALQASLDATKPEHDIEGLDGHTEAGTFAHSLAVLAPAADPATLDVLLRKLFGCSAIRAIVEAIQTVARGTADSRATAALLSMFDTTAAPDVAWCIVDAICDIAIDDSNRAFRRMLFEQAQAARWGRTSSLPPFLNALLQIVHRGEQCGAKHAAQLIGRVAQPGDPAVITTLLRTLANGKDDARAAAAESLGWVAFRDDAEVLTALAKALRDHNGTVRERAAESMGKVALRGDLGAVAALAATLADARLLATPMHRIAAAALGQIAAQGDEIVIDTLLQVLPLRNFGIAKSAVVALGQVAREGDARVTAALIHLLQTNNCVEVLAVAAAALRALGVRELKRQRSEDVGRE